MVSTLLCFYRGILFFNVKNKKTKENKTKEIKAHSIITAGLEPTATIGRTQ